MPDRLINSRAKVQQSSIEIRVVRELDDCRRCRCTGPSSGFVAPGLAGCSSFVRGAGRREASRRARKLEARDGQWKCFLIFLSLTRTYKATLRPEMNNNTNCATNTLHASAANAFPFSVIYQISLNCRSRVTRRDAPSREGTTADLSLS